MDVVLSAAALALPNFAVIVDSAGFGTPYSACMPFRRSAATARRIPSSPQIASARFLREAEPLRIGARLPPQPLPANALLHSTLEMLRTQPQQVECRMAFY